MNQFEDLNQRILKIEKRNNKVELDKAWETSNFRKISIALLTYFVMTIFMWSLGNDKPFMNAIIPTLGFVLSTVSLPFVQSIWVRFCSSDQKLNRDPIKY